MTYEQQQTAQQEGATSMFSTPAPDEVQDFGSNAAQAEALGASSGEAGSGVDIPADASREQLIQHVTRALTFVANRQMVGLGQFERDAVVQDPPPYVRDEMSHLSTFCLTVAFEALKAAVTAKDPLVAFLLTQVVEAAEKYAETWVPDLIDPSGGKITVDLLEDLVDQTSLTLSACWNVASGVFINEQDSFDEADLHALATLFDRVGTLASDLQYGACLGGWVNYCGRAVSGDAPFDPDFVVHLGVYADHIRPGEPVPARLHDLPAVGEELRKEMLRFSVSGAQVRLRVTDPMGIDFVVEPGGLLLEDKSTGMGRHYLYCLGGNKPHLWNPGQPPQVDPTDPEYVGHVTNGAQLLALQHVDTPLAQFAAV